jgi:hypothetical protein
MGVVGLLSLDVATILTQCGRGTRWNKGDPQIQTQSIASSKILWGNGRES